MCVCVVLCTWLASSLVGEMTTALKPRLAGCCRCASSGRQKAKVFPDPVGAQASSSRPWSRNQTHGNPHKTTVRTPFTKTPNVRASALTCIMSGIACICTGVGEFRPASLRFWRTRGLRRYSDCSSSNVHTGSGTSQPCTLIRCWDRIRFTWGWTIRSEHRQSGAFTEHYGNKSDF